MIIPAAELFSQGDEVVTGEITDTNAAWLATELTGLGFEVTRHSTVGDSLEALVRLLCEIAGRADLCLCTGGLGPTCDDLTAEAVSLAFERPLALDSVALTQIESWFRRMDRVMPAVNRKQALLPHGAERLDNHWGTAPGFTLTTGRCRFYFMPGVPREMQAMAREAILPQLPRQFALRPRPRVILRTVGLGESTLQERLDPVILPYGVQLGFRAGGAENQVKLAFPPGYDDTVVNRVVDSVAAAIGGAVYAIVRNGEGPGSLAAVAGDLLVQRGARLHIVETVSGGLLASRCGGADWLAGATVANAPARLLARLSMQRSATTAETATALAEAIRDRESVDYALVQYGEFDLAVLRDEKARAEVCFAVAGPDGGVAESRILTGALQRKADSAAVFSLDLLRRHVSGRS